MENEFQKMQRLAGVPVTEDKKQLDENFVGLPMVGNIFDRPKADYELAYEHYLGKLNEIEVEEGKKDKKGKTFEFTFDYNTDDDDIEYVQNILHDAGVDAIAEKGIMDDEVVVKALNKIELRRAKKAIQGDGFQIQEDKSEELYEEEGSNSEVILSNEILDFLEERGIIDPSDAQKVHKDLTSFLKSKTNGKKEDDLPSNPEDYTKQSGYIHEEEGADGEENPIDSITMDVPLFIRMLEFAREDASTDMDLHDVAEKATALSAEGEILSMDNYEDIVGGETEELNEYGKPYKVGTYRSKDGQTFTKYRDDENYTSIMVNGYYITIDLNGEGENPSQEKIQDEINKLKKIAPQPRYQGRNRY